MQEDPCPAGITARDWWVLEEEEESGTVQGSEGHRYAELDMSHAPEKPRGTSPWGPRCWGQGWQPGRSHLGKKVVDDGVVQDGAGPVIQQLETVGLSQPTPVGEEEPDVESGGGSAPRPPSRTAPISHQRLPREPGWGRDGRTAGGCT